ncbi:MAG: PUA domain-containing protein [Promethearchaeota archaeon]
MTTGKRGRKPLAGPRVGDRTVAATAGDWEVLRAACNFQFGRGSATVVFPSPDRLGVQRSPRTGKIRYVFEGDTFLATVRATHGTLALSGVGFRRLWGGRPPPAHRVVVREDVAKYIALGGNVFAKHVVDAWESIRPMDDVLVTDGSDVLLAAGRARLNRREMLDFQHGVAVEVRWGVKKKNKGSND